MEEKKKVLLKTPCCKANVEASGNEYYEILMYEDSDLSVVENNFDPEIDFEYFRCLECGKEVEMKCDEEGNKYRFELVDDGE